MTQYFRVSNLLKKKKIHQVSGATPAPDGIQNLVGDKHKK